MPDIAYKVMRMVDDPQTSAADIARVVSADQAMAARILKLANSAFYGASRRIGTVTEAVVLLGMRTVRNMTVALKCQEYLNAALPGYTLEQGDLWRHSFCCAYAAQCLAKRSGYRIAEEAFVGGLLHDIGKVVVNVYMQAEFVCVSKVAASEGIAFMDAERAVLGFDHAEAGGRVLEKWNLPQTLVECVRYHHAPLQQPTPTPLTGIVHVADVLCLMLGVGLGADGLNYPLQEGTLETLRLDEKDFEETTLHVSSALSEAEMLF
jgi:putative nucleotidyltransferase with HDIG domain